MRWSVVCKVDKKSMIKNRYKRIPHSAPRGVRGYSYMKVVYMCRPEFENGGLRERPLTENGGLQPLTEQRGDFGTKNSKEMSVLKGGGVVFWSSPGRKSGTKNKIYMFKKGVFRSGPGQEVESLGAAQAEKWGTFGWHTPALSYK